MELQQRTPAAQSIETQRAVEHKQSPSQIPQYQPPQQVAQASTATSSSPSYRTPEKSLWQQLKFSPAWKYMLLAGALLTAWAMWMHHQGQATIYNDYTDAAITNLLPAAGVVLTFLMNWLELPRQLAMVAGLTGFILAFMFAVYASVRTNQGWLSISLSPLPK
ncbi:hypothetical protein ACIOWK_33420 [Pseudomonas protegens]|uniref:hypothetical protein n=1 Tax=Pseudomonas protegens TaxID=380021 RepID=UPI00382BAAB5